MVDETVSKVSDSAILIERTVANTTTNQLEYDDLLRQLDSLKAAKSASSDEYDVQIADVMRLLGKADDLGVKSKLEAILESVQNVISMF
jgi:hypothetical protein